MKNIFKSLLWAAFAFCITSCGEVDMGNTPQAEKGLLSLTAKIAGESQVFSPTKRGPYKDGDVIEFKFPSPIEDPVDLSKVNLIVSLENDCFVQPGLPGTIDLTSPFELRVKTAVGVVKTYIIKAIPVGPIATFKKGWFKNGNDLDYIWPVWISSIAISNNDFVLYDGVENYDESYIKVYGEKNGDLKKKIKAPHTFISQVKTDDAGHIIAARENIYGAGFMLYYYEDMNSEPKLLLDYMHDNGCPLLLGYRFSIVGNLKEGKAYIYALSGNTYFGAQGKEYYRFEFNDGVPISTVPVKVDFSDNITGVWESANIQRLTTADNSDIYLSYFQYSNSDTQQLLGSHIYCFNEELNNLTEMNRKNFDYKLLGFRVFEIDGHRFLAMLTQAFGSSSVCMKVFDITDKNNWTAMNPDSDNYNEFLIFESEQYAVNNINQWGDVAVKVDNNKAQIYATIVSADKSQSGVAMYEMTYYPPTQQ